METTQVKVQDIETALCGIAEIKAARIVTTAGGGIAEVHVLALPTKQPKQLVRDIESLLMALFGIPIDHKKISIAQIGAEAVSESLVPDATPAFARPRIVSVHTTRSGLVASAQVTVEIIGEEFTGHASGPASATGRYRQVADAALDALGQWTGEAVGFALEDVSVLALGHERAAVACVSIVTPQGEDAFVGSALIKQTENDAIVRATLDSINRRIGLMTTA